MTNKLKIFSLITILCLFSTGAGYIGDLPNINNHFNFVKEKNDQIQNQNINDKVDKNQNILPLDPTDIPDFKSRILIKQGTYSAYLKDVEQIIPVLERLKDCINNQSNVQYFSARAKNLNFYIDNLKIKYKKSKEVHYDTFKALIDLNYQAQSVSTFQIERNQNIKYISNYDSYGTYSQKIINRELNNLLYKIDETILLIKESAL